MINQLAPRSAPATNALVARSGPQQSGPIMHPNPAAFIRGMNLQQQVIVKEAGASTYAAQEFGKLARNPDVTHKDVINSAGQAVADGQITPTQAVQMLSQVPQDPDKLKGWLDQQYANHLTASVHLKAMLMQPPAAPPQGAQPVAAPAAAPVAMNPNAAPAPGNAPEPVTTGA